MKFAALGLVAAASAANVSPEVMSAFQLFQQKYGKTYSDAEFPKRAAVFAENLEKVQARNLEHMLVGGDAVFGITQFMDLTEAEFKATYLSGYIPPTGNSTRVVPKMVGAPATTVDWRTKGVVTPVKNQGQCGSCWAFSATAAIESYGALSGKYKLEVLSPQQINSCDKVDQGCNGGNTETAYQYVVQAGGIETEASYPYTSGTGITGFCKFSASKIAVSITGYTGVAQGEDNLKTALNAGPVSVCLAATAFQTYSSGVLKYCPGFIDHCVQAVGYDDGYSTPYWTIRNSWNTDWGEKGYIRLEQGHNICKVSNDVTFPTF
jgi:C1A family cysteine protease